MKNKFNTLLTLRLVMGVITGFLVVNSMYIYSRPLNGCENGGFSTLEPGCTMWWYFGLGLAVVFIFWVIKPKYVISKYLGLMLVALMALLGGPEAIKYGYHLEIFTNPSNMKFYWLEHGLAILFGGIVGATLLIVLEKWLGLSNTK